MQHSRNKVTASVLLSITLVACANNTPAPVIDLISNSSSTSNVYRSVPNNTQSIASNNGIHLVKPGETLFSIAWRYSLDFNQLAKINHIKASRIYPGQQLKLQNHSTEVFSSQSLLAAINKEVLNKRVAPVITHRIAKNKRLSHNKTQSPGKSSKSASVSSKSRKANQRSRPSTQKSQRVALASTNISVKRWIWPVNGKIINHFSKQRNKNKGVDISAKRGSPVRAAANGKVVYSGRGLRGYGRLVIIKHNDAFLSAYAHNEKLHVEQNEFVKAGQRIADLGSSDSDREKLHFEIRYKGKPVDPLNYLPKSGVL